MLYTAPLFKMYLVTSLVTVLYKMCIFAVKHSYIFHRVEIQDLKLEESAQMVAELTERLKQYEDDLEAKENVSSTTYTIRYTVNL